MTIEEINYISLKEKYPEIPLGKGIDVSYKTFGKFVPLYRTLNQKERTYWVCYCMCGNPDSIKPYDISSVRAGRSKSCGCLQKIDKIKQRNENIVGTIVNGWTIIEALPYNGGHKYYKCECNCEKHTQKIARLDSLKANYAGCDFCSNNPNKLIDLTGQKFGHWTVLEKSSSKEGHTMWRCQCDCTQKTVRDIDAYRLKNKRSTSCGCDSRSFGEKTIAFLLDNQNIPYIQEQSFPSCKMKKYGQLRFDFYVDNQYLIEYDGEQHFIERPKGWNSPEKLKQIQERDAFKNNWCKENHIPLIRIPYTHLNKLCIEDLLLETSKFIV